MILKKETYSLKKLSKERYQTY